MKITITIEDDGTRTVEAKETAGGVVLNIMPGKADTDALVAEVSRNVAAAWSLAYETVEAERAPALAG
jgi:hypothetical protein